MLGGGALSASAARAATPDRERSRNAAARNRLMGDLPRTILSEAAAKISSTVSYRLHGGFHAIRRRSLSTPARRFGVLQRRPRGSGREGGGERGKDDGAPENEVRRGRVDLRPVRQALR